MQWIANNVLNVFNAFYNMLTGISAEGYSEVLNLKKAVEINYHKGIYDEFMPPIKLIGSPDIESGERYNFI